MEQRHHRFKRAMAQELMLRGSVDFLSVDAYKSFLRVILERLNAGRGQRLHEEMEAMRELPARRMESFKCERVKVDSGSLIYVDRNVYSVSQPLIGEQVEARLLWATSRSGTPEEGRGVATIAWAAETSRQLPAHHRLAGAEAGRF